jgi:hypothetical protein
MYDNVLPIMLFVHHSMYLLDLSDNEWIIYREYGQLLSSVLSSVTRILSEEASIRCELVLLRKLQHENNFSSTRTYNTYIRTDRISSFSNRIVGMIV